MNWIEPGCYLPTVKSFSLLFRWFSFLILFNKHSILNSSFIHCYKVFVMSALYAHIVHCRSNILNRLIFIIIVPLTCINRFIRCRISFVPFGLRLTLCFCLVEYRWNWEASCWAHGSPCRVRTLGKSIDWA